MGIVDFILNLAGLLLWLNWRAEKTDPVGKRKPATLIGTLKRADAKSRNWQLPSLIAGLVFLRAIFYWLIGSSARWSGKLDLNAVILWFPIPNDSFQSLGKEILFSISSFALMLAIFYLSLLLLSILDGPEPFRAVLRLQLGNLDRWPRWKKLFLPFAAVTILWWLASWLFAWLQIIPPPATELNRAGEAAVVGLGSYLAWEFIIIALLILHLLNSYIYFGRHPFWNFINAEAQTLLSPLRKIPLRFAKINFAPLIGIALVIFISIEAGKFLAWLYGKI
jgi:uncharacterized protein YggT (Ycf19 family)